MFENARRTTRTVTVITASVDEIGRISPQSTDKTGQITRSRMTHCRDGLALRREQCHHGGSMIRLLLTALLATFSHMPARHCIERRFDEITAAADDASERFGVPPALLLSVGFHETWLGCHGERDWGAPVDRRHRHTAGTPADAAASLAVGLRVCGTWNGAITRFRSGLCTVPPGDPRRAYVRSVLRLSRRVMARARRHPDAARVFAEQHAPAPRASAAPAPSEIVLDAQIVSAAPSVVVSDEAGGEPIDVAAIPSDPISD